MRAPWGLRFGAHALTAIAALFVALRFVYPGYVAPLAAVHADQYAGAAAVAKGLTVADMLAFARPVNDVVSLVTARAGYRAMIACYLALTLLVLVLAMTLCERRLLGRVIPWWIAFPTFVLAMSSSNFSSNAGYDPGSLAAAFGLLGIVVWEARWPLWPAAVTTGLLFVLSALSKESFLGVILLYALVEAWEYRRDDRRRAAWIVSLAIFAAAAAFLDARAVHSPFVFVARSTSPYAMDVHPASLAAAAGFYLGPLFSAGFGLLAVCCALGIWLRRRWQPAVVAAAGAAALLAPYLVLPHHLLGYYAWVPWPALMLLVPIAWTPSGRSRSSESFGPPWQMRASGAAIALALGATLVGIRAQPAAVDWSLQQQNVNRSMMDGLRSLRPSLRTAHAVLLCGVSFPFHPWEYAPMLRRETGFYGRWSMVADPGGGPPDRTVRVLDARDVRWSDYDMIVVFAADGSLVASYRPAELYALDDELGRHESRADTIALLRAPSALPLNLLAPAAREGATHDFIDLFANGSIDSRRVVSTPSRKGAFLIAWPFSRATLPSLTLVAPFRYSYPNIRIGASSRFVFFVARPYATAPVRAAIDIASGGLTAHVYREDLPPAPTSGSGLHWELHEVDMSRFAHRTVRVTFSAIAPTADQSGTWIAFGIPRLVDFPRR